MSKKIDSKKAASTTNLLALQPLGTQAARPPLNSLHTTLCCCLRAWMVWQGVQQGAVICRGMREAHRLVPRNEIWRRDWGSIFTPSHPPNPQRTILSPCCPLCNTLDLPTSTGLTAGVCLESRVCSTPKAQGLLAFNDVKHNGIILHLHFF